LERGLAAKKKRNVRNNIVENQVLQLFGFNFLQRFVLSLKPNQLKPVALYPYTRDTPATKPCNLLGRMLELSCIIFLYLVAQPLNLLGSYLSKELFDNQHRATLSSNCSLRSVVDNATGKFIAT